MYKIKLGAFGKKLMNNLLIMLLLISTQTSAKYQSLVPVDIVFTMDLSASTNGLVDDLRDKIWDMNNQLSRLRPSPDVRFAVVGFSRPSFGADNQYVKVLVPLTSDVDFLASELYKIRPNIEKGDQFVGAAIRASLELLDWSKADNAVRQIFLVGNGSVGLGAFNFRESYELAIKKGINVQSFYCHSSLRAKDFPGWKEIAKQTGGNAVDIKIHKRMVDYSSVENFDRLKQLARELSSTYIYYGKNGSDRYKAMLNNDKNALASGKGTFEAMLYNKISDNNQGKQNEWDLVDLIKSRSGKLNQVDPKTLPDSLRKNDPEQLMTKLILLKEKRSLLVTQMRSLLPYQRQAQLETYLSNKEDDRTLMLDYEAMKIILQKLEEKGISAN